MNHRLPKTGMLRKIRFKMNLIPVSHLLTFNNRLNRFSMHNEKIYLNKRINRFLTNVSSKFSGHIINSFTFIHNETKSKRKERKYK